MIRPALAFAPLMALLLLPSQAEQAQPGWTLYPPLQPADQAFCSFMSAQPSQQELAEFMALSEAERIDLAKGLKQQGCLPPDWMQKHLPNRFADPMKIDNNEAQ
jgi:hypothetical protein